MSKNNGLINFSGQTLVKVLYNQSYTVPDTVTSASATSSAGLSPTTIFDATRQVAGGEIFATFSDIAGNAVTQLNCTLSPGDVVACSAVASSTITVTVTPVGGTAITVGTFAATTVGGILLRIG